jgi:hypothetical protein
MVVQEFPIVAPAINGTVPSETNIPLLPAHRPDTDEMVAVPVILNVGFTGKAKLVALGKELTCSSIPRLSPIIL